MTKTTTFYSISRNNGLLTKSRLAGPGRKCISTMSETHLPYPQVRSILNFKDCCLIYQQQLVSLISKYSMYFLTSTPTGTRRSVKSHKRYNVTTTRTRSLSLNSTASGAVHLRLRVTSQELGVTVRSRGGKARRRFQFCGLRKHLLGTCKFVQGGQFLVMLRFLNVLNKTF